MEAAWPSLLPDSILYQIFLSLDPEDLLSAGLVCRRWYAVSRDDFLWKDLFYRHYHVQRLIHRYPGQGQTGFSVGFGQEGSHGVFSVGLGRLETGNMGFAAVDKDSSLESLLLSNLKWPYKGWWLTHSRGTGRFSQSMRGYQTGFVIFVDRWITASRLRKAVTLLWWGRCWATTLGRGQWRSHALILQCKGDSEKDFFH